MISRLGNKYSLLFLGAIGTFMILIGNLLVDIMVSVERDKYLWFETGVESVLIIFLGWVIIVLFKREMDRKSYIKYQLSTLEARNEALVKFSPVGIFTADAKGDWVKVNLAMARIYGCENDVELMEFKPNLWDFYGHKASWEIKTAMSGTLDCLNEIETEITRKDHTKSWISTSIRVVHDSFGGVDYYEGFVQDISPRKRNLMAFHERAGFVQTLFESIPTLLSAQRFWERYMTAIILFMSTSSRKARM